MTDDQVSEYAQKRAESKENFIACYLAETGLKPSEVMLVEKHSDNGLRIEWYCEPRQAVFSSSQLTLTQQAIRAAYQNILDVRRAFQETTEANE